MFVCHSATFWTQNILSQGKQTFCCSAGWNWGVIARGGVENTRLEAKIKDTKKSEAKAKDSLSKDRHSRGQGQECSRPRPRTQAQVLSKKKGLHKNFSGDLQKKGLHKNFSSDLHEKTFSRKIFKRSTKF